MNKNTSSLKIFLFSQALLSTEWLSLLGDKYVRALKFSWEFTDALENADIIVWDGVMTPKLELYEERLLKKLRGGSILLLQGDLRTLYENHPFVTLISLDQLRFVEVSGWSVLPEELLMALTSCHQKIAHV